MSIPKSRSANSSPVQRAGADHYFTPTPSVVSRPRAVRLRLGEIDVELQSDRGVFGFRGIDLGTQILLREAPPPPGSGDLLDLGCGYGPIAVALALRSPDSEVWAIDVNERALELTRTNAAAAGARNVRVALPDDLPADVKFAAIYSNPPVRVGKAPLHEMLLRWLPRLRPSAAAYLVVQRNLGSDSLATWLAGQGFGVTRLKSKKGYRVLEVRPTPSPEN